MIESIEINNIQSHKNTVLTLSKGINCIVGSSNSGKTAVLRALYWARYNRPLGVDTLASHWAINEKGELSAEMLVVVKTDRGTVARKRTKTDNQYIVNGNVLNVVKSDVPREVEDVLCLSETNIQRQMDAPFLLSSTSGEVAKYFNKVVRLDVIDRILSNAESKKRKARAEITELEEVVANNEERLAGFGWLDDAEKLIRKYERTIAKSKELSAEIEALKSQLAEYDEKLSIVEGCDFSGQKKLITKLEKEALKRNNLFTEIERLSGSIETFSSVKVYPDFAPQKAIVAELLVYRPDRKTVDALKAEVYQYGIQKMHIENGDAEVKCLKKQLPKVCPLCGSSMGKCMMEVDPVMETFLRGR